MLYRYCLLIIQNYLNNLMNLMIKNIIWCCKSSRSSEYDVSHLRVIQYVCNMAAYSDTKALTRRYPNNSFLSWLLSSLSLGGCFLRNLNIADLSYFDLGYHFLSCKTKQHTDDATPHKGPKIDTRLSQYTNKFRYAIIRFIWLWEIKIHYLLSLL